jgi:hypothetical protein
MTPLRAKWFNTKTGIVGIVYAQDDFDAEIKEFFIGVAQGLHEPIDISNIANIGTPFPKDVGNLLFGITDDTDRNPAGISGMAEQPQAPAGVPTVETKRRPRKSKAT